jgi:hypothetical protein
MPYSLRETPGGIELDVAASGRESLVRESLHGVLEALYGKEAIGGPGSGQAIPIQAAGVTLGQSLPELVAELLDLAPKTQGPLGPPRWLAFDEGRLTATLPVLDAPRLVARALRLASVRVVGNGARFVLFPSATGR